MEHEIQDVGSVKILCFLHLFFSVANSVTPQSVAVAQQPPITGYQAQYEQIRDPRILQQAAPQQGYQATFEVQKPQLVSPQIQNNGYQARFEQSQR